MREFFLTEEEKSYLRLHLLTWKERTKKKFDSIVFMQIKDSRVKVLIDRDFVEGLKELLGFESGSLEEECSYILLDMNSAVYKLNHVDDSHGNVFQ